MNSSIDSTDDVLLIIISMFMFEQFYLQESLKLMVSNSSSYVVLVGIVIIIAGGVIDACYIDGNISHGDISIGFNAANYDNCIGRFMTFSYLELITLSY